MISKPWRDRLIYLAMSLFIAWNVMSMIIAPAPENSPTVQSLRPLFRPYWALFRLESPWSFFEAVARVPQFRYVIEGADGKEHTFVPVEEFSWYHPRYNWFERIYWAIMDSPDTFGDHFVASLCRQHAALKPVRIAFQAVTGGEYRPEDELRGHRPMDAEFVTVDTFVYADCPQ